MNPYSVIMLNVVRLSLCLYLASVGIVCAQPFAVGRFPMHIGHTPGVADGLPETPTLSIALRPDGVFLAHHADGAYAFQQGRWSRQPDGIPVEAWQGPDPRPIPPHVLASIPVEPVTVHAQDALGGVWVGTPRGAAYYANGEWRYRQGRRWLPHDHVLDLRIDKDGHALFLTPAGLGMIQRRLVSLADKAAFFEDEIDKRHRRTEFEYVLEVKLKQPGDLSAWEQHDSDNDGLWTGMYGAAQCFAYGATKSTKAKERATKALRALGFLSEVTQGGAHPAPTGFPARSILPTSGRDPNVGDSLERDRHRRQHHDRKWKVLTPRWPRSADGKWFWKTDTSSDELDGHYFFYGLYYDLVAEADAEREEVRRVVRRITDHLLTHEFSLVDHDGDKTRWGVFGPNDINLDPSWWVERGLNSLSMLTYLRVAQHVTGDAKYGAAADLLIDKHGYNNNLMFPKNTPGVGGGNQSDDEMAFMNYYHLLKYETRPAYKAMYALSLASYWELEKPERNPFFDFVAASQLRGMRYQDAHDVYELSPKPGWANEAMETLRRFPLNLVEWPMLNSHRRDLQPLPAYVRPDREPGTLFLRRDGKVIPIDERTVFHWNLDPYRVDSGGTGMRLADGTSFLLPYYMGLYEKFIQD
jgi:hypothetical protein